MPVTRLLLIDERPQDIAQCMRMPQASHLDLVACNTAMEGLRALETQDPFDCVIVDFSDQDSPGLEFIDLARSNSTSPPVLMLTSTCTGRGVEALRAGAEDYLVKEDLQPGELFRAVKHAIVRHRIRAQLEAREAQLKTLACYDPLTGVLNRRGLEDAFATLNEHASVTALLIDCDDFKSVNSRFGHAAGDRALCTVADVLRAGLRDRDHLARVGGDEFIVLMPHISLDEAIGIADRLQYRIAHADAAGPRVTVSIGVASLPSTVRTATDILQCTQAALAESKRRGKNAVASLPGIPQSAYDNHAQRENDLSRILSLLPVEPERAIEILSLATHQISMSGQRRTG